jgi:hypothetical protein
MAMPTGNLSSITSLAPLNPFVALLPLPGVEAGGMGVDSQFAALLGQIAPTSATPAMEAPDPSAPVPPEALPIDSKANEGVQAPAAASPAAEHLPDGGKTLPLPLPLPLPPMAIAAPARMHTTQLHAAEPADAFETDRKESAAPPAAPVPPQLAMASPALSLQTVVLEGTATPPEPEFEPAPAPPQPAVPPLATSSVRPGQTEPGPAYSGPITTAAAPTLPVLPVASAQPAHRPASPLQPAAAEPVPPALAVPVRQIQAASRRSEDVPPPVPAGIAPAPPSMPAESYPAIARLQPEIAAPRPLDFGALVDRLLAAREEGTAHAVTLAVPHADFGRVALRFHHGESGLSISLASSDPDFARAAAQALPPAQPVPSTAASGPQDAATQPDRQHASSDLSGQARHPGRDPRAGGADQRQPGQAPLRDDPPTERRSRGGIFA